MWYNVDVYKLGLQLLPPLLRKRVLFAFLRALLCPFRMLAELFRTFRRSSLSRLNVNGQVIYIEKALNDAFELQDGEIYLSDTDDLMGSCSVLYPQPEGSAMVFGGDENEILYIPAGGDGKADGDYIVNVPSFLEAELESIKTIVEYNKPAGRRYVIKVYEYE